MLKAYFVTQLCSDVIKYYLLMSLKFVHRAEQDKEIEMEAAPEVSGAGPTEESTAEGNLSFTPFRPPFFFYIMPYWVITLFLVAAAPVIDEYDLVDPVDILTPLEKSGFWDGVVSIPIYFPNFKWIMFC